MERKIREGRVDPSLINHHILQTTDLLHKYTMKSVGCQSLVFSLFYWLFSFHTFMNNKDGCA